VRFKIFCDRILRKEFSGIYAIVPGKKGVAKLELKHDDLLSTLALAKIVE
jgi:hypothetical protein